jgi:excinuclease ABC subunit C
VTAETLERKLQALPPKPGVYLFKDQRGEILYVGKAKSLRSRVRNHFAIDDNTMLKNREMVRRIRDVDTIVVGSEAEALLLEANLIKAHHPRFNIRLKDDKKYPYIKVTMQEAFPRVYVTRTLANDGARYFGPYTEVGTMRHSLEVIKRVFTVRSCRYDLPTESPARPCLDYHIGRCQAPCVGLQEVGAYRQMIDEVIDVLNGRTDGLRSRVDRQMADAAARMDFEAAAAMRDVLVALDALDRRQRMMDIRGGDQDVVGIARDGGQACSVLLRIRDGKLLGRELDFFENLEDEDDAALLTAAATRFYLGRGEHGTADLPREVLLPGEFDDRAVLEELLSDAEGRKVQVFAPQRGEKLRLVELANQNARHLLEERSVMAEVVRERADDVLYELQESLELKVVPRLIVCFDISHTQGSELVGSAVVFRNGEPYKAEYRRFRIKGEWRNDDFRSMGEIVGRYFRRRLEEQLPLPELAIIDGGKGQLSAAVAAASAAGANDVAFIGLAKREEEIYLVGRSDPLRLARTNPGLRLLQRARNEAHRFAITYNRNLRKKRTLSSELSEIPGVGPARQQALLARFGSVRGVRAASPEEIATVPGFSFLMATRILEHLTRPQDVFTAESRRNAEFSRSDSRVAEE